ATETDEVLAVLRATQAASMEPSRERDGDVVDYIQVLDGVKGLQWSRRANATETPCITARTTSLHQAWLQWSRRANATETAQRKLDERLRKRASMEPSRERDGDMVLGRFA